VLNKAWTKVRNFANIFTSLKSYVILWAHKKSEAPMSAPTSGGRILRKGVLCLY